MPLLVSSHFFSMSARIDVMSGALIAPAAFSSSAVSLGKLVEISLRSLRRAACDVVERSLKDARE